MRLDTYVRLVEAGTYWADGFGCVMSSSKQLRKYLAVVGGSSGKLSGLGVPDRRFNE